MRSWLMCGYIFLMTCLSAISVFLISLPVMIKAALYCLLGLYSYFLLRRFFFLKDRRAVKKIIYMGNNYFQCELGNGHYCFARLSDDSIFTRSFVLMRFLVEGSYRTLSVPLFKTSSLWQEIQDLRMALLFDR